MLRLFVFACLYDLVFADSVIPSDKNAEIISSDNQNLGNGNYEFSYVTSNGIQRHETGRLVDLPGRNKFIVVQGSFSYREPDETITFLEYIADEKGYRVKNYLRFNPVKEDLDLNTLTNRFQSVSPQLVASLLGG